MGIKENLESSAEEQDRIIAFNAFAGSLTEEQNELLFDALPKSILILEANDEAEKEEVRIPTFLLTSSGHAMTMFLRFLEEVAAGPLKEELFRYIADINS